MSAIDELTETLKKSDNEGTAAPYWLIIDPHSLGLRWQDDDEITFTTLDDDNCKRIGDSIPNCITGPFFSREDAESHLRARHYNFSKDAYVYCHSGYWSQKYKAMCREIGVGT